MNNVLQKPQKDIIEISDFNSFSVIGDPGCDGLGTYNLKIFCDALNKANESDIILIAGDLVPTGSDKYYKLVSNIINTVAEKPVYSLPGNHDTGEYEKHFGLTRYAVVSGDKAIVVLNNMYRGFEPEGLQILKKVLKRDDINKVFVTFHIPIPNNYSGNAVSKEEADKLYDAISENKQKVKAIICGHLHSRFEDRVWDIPLICTGGGGAIIEDVSESIKAGDVNHHIYEFKTDGSYKLIDLETSSPERVFKKDDILKKRLEESVKDELMAHLKYLIYADRAKNRGLDGLSEVFKALASSEFHHARNFYSIMEAGYPFADSLDGFISTEKYEYDHIYKMLVAYSKESGNLLSENAYLSALNAEKEHARILEGVIDMGSDAGTKTPGTDPSPSIDMGTDPSAHSSAPLNLYVCPICGYIMEGQEPPSRCPVCGRPDKAFEEYSISK